MSFFKVLESCQYTKWHRLSAIEYCSGMTPVLAAAQRLTGLPQICPPMGMQCIHMHT
jgi:hypothetical protein